MNAGLKNRLLIMAAATGLASMGVACGGGEAPAADEGASAETSGGEGSCSGAKEEGGEGSCSGAKEEDKEAGGEGSCGEGSCGG